MRRGIQDTGGSPARNVGAWTSCAPARLLACSMAAVAGLLWSAVPATAQTVGNEGSGWVGPWHAAMGLAERLASDSAAMADVLAAVESQLALGRPENALELLARHMLPDSMEQGAPLALYAAAQFALGRYSEAGRVFDLAADHATGLRRGTLRAQAGVAFERGGLTARAAALYGHAARDYPDAAGWLAVRVARITRDAVAARNLLGLAPEGSRPLTAEVRAELLVRDGDPAGAAAVLAQVGRFSAAARLALEAGELDRAREWTYRAAATRDETEALSGMELALLDFPPGSPEEYTAIARAALRYGRASDAVEYASGAVAAADSSVTTLMFYAEVAEASGNRWGALRVYEAAADREGPEAAEAQYRYARAFVRLGQRTRAAPALQQFLREHPDHSRAPAATYLLADLRQDQRRVAEADSIYRLLHEKWPASQFASTARSRLAARALAAGDVAAAMEMFRAEAEARGSRSRAAHYQLARLAQRTGDTATALEEWAALAGRDSIGYYGTMARQAAGLPLPVFAPRPAVEASPEVTRQLAVLDLLQGADLQAEAEALIAHLTDPEVWDVAELMDVAEGLIDRGQARTAVNVGWRIVGLHRLNDPRVLRIIFPWPDRELLEREAREFDLDPFLLVALVRQESAFDPDATSRAGARGMMQLMPATARGLARRLRVDWHNSFLAIADANVHLGAAHLAQMLQQYGDVVPALAAYNAGGSRARRWMRYPEARAGDWFSFVERIPFPETRGYVQTLLRNRELYRALYGERPRP